MQPDRAVQRTALLSEAWEMLKQTYAEWSDDDAAQLAAALAYYTIFSLAPLLIVAIALAGLVFGREAVQGELVKYIATLVGPEGYIKEKIAAFKESGVTNLQVTAIGGDAIGDLEKLKAWSD